MNEIIQKDLEELLKRDLEYEKLRNQTIFILGLNSLIGRYFAYCLLYLNEKYFLNLKVIGTIRNMEKFNKYFKDYINSESLKVIQYDVCDLLQLNDKVDYILHTAGYASAYHIINQPIDIIKANTIGTINALEFAKEKEIKNFVFVSTREVYGKIDSNIHKITEKDLGVLDSTDPRNCYPESKRLAENIIISYNKQYQIPYTILRVAHTYGPTMELQNDGRVLADFINNAVHKNDIILNSDGSAVRSFCYITDTIYGIILTMLSQEKNQIYNLSNETEPYPIREVAKMIANVSNNDIKVVFNLSNVQYKNGYAKFPLVPMDTTKIENLGWSPSMKLHDGLNRTLDYNKLNIINKGINL